MHQTMHQAGGVLPVTTVPVSAAIGSPKVTRQVIRISAAEAAKAGYVRGSLAIGGGGTHDSSALSWDILAARTSHSWRGGVEWADSDHRSDSHSSSAQTTQATTVQAAQYVAGGCNSMEGARGNGAAQMPPRDINLQVNREAGSSGWTGAGAAGEHAYGGVHVASSGDSSSQCSPAAGSRFVLEPYVPGMSPDKGKASAGIKVLQHVPVQQHQHLHVSSSGSNNSCSTPEARVIQPVRVHTRHPVSPVKDMRQVEDSLSSLLKGIGQARVGPPSPLKKGFHTLETTLQGVQCSMTKTPGSGGDYHSPTIRWKAAMGIQAAIRMALRQRRMWDNAVFALEDLISRKGRVSGCVKNDAIIAEVGELSSRIISAERDLFWGLSRRCHPTQQNKRVLDTHPLVLARMLAAQAITASVRRRGKQDAFASYHKYRHLQEAIVRPNASQTPPPPTQTPAPPTPQAPGAPKVLTPAAIAAAVIRQRDARPGGSPLQQAGSPRGASAGLRAALGGESPMGRGGYESSGVMRCDGAASQRRLAPQRSLLGAFTPPSPPKSDAQPATSSKPASVSLSTWGRRSAGGDADEAILDFARAHIASGLLDGEAGGRGEMWNEQEC